MTHPIRLEDFTVPAGGLAPDPAGTISDPGGITPVQVRSYEEGYKAGWDDAIKSESDKQDHVHAELARNLGDLGFTLQEARSSLLNALEDLIVTLVDNILPKAAKATLGQLIHEEVLGLAAQVVDRPLCLAVCPADHANIQKLLPKIPGLPLTLENEDSLSAGQLYLRAGSTETLLDIDAVLSRVSNAVAAAMEDPKMEVPAHA